MSDALADLDPAAYVRPPVLDVSHGLALGTALLTVADPTMPATVQRATARLQTAVLVLEHRAAEDASTDADAGDDARTADLRLDRAWVAVGRRLEVLADLPPHLPEAEEAARLHRGLFPEGLAFLNLPFREQWAHSDQRLRLVEDDDLGPRLAPLVGGFVLDELWAAHEEYGRVLGIEDPTASLGAPARQVEGLRELRDAIAAYVLQLLAVAHDDPGRADAVRAALSPIDVARHGAPPEAASEAAAVDPSAQAESKPEPELDSKSEPKSEPEPKSKPETTPASAKLSSPAVTDDDDLEALLADPFGDDAP